MRAPTTTVLFATVWLAAAGASAATGGGSRGNQPQGGGGQLHGNGRGQGWSGGNQSWGGGPIQSLSVTSGDQGPNGGQGPGAGPNQNGGSYQSSGPNQGGGPNPGYGPAPSVGPDPNVGPNPPPGAVPESEAPPAPPTPDPEPAMSPDDLRDNFKTVVQTYLTERSRRGVWTYREPGGRALPLALVSIDDGMPRAAGRRRYAGGATLRDVRRGRRVRLEFTVDLSGTAWRVVSVRPAARPGRKTAPR